MKKQLIIAALAAVSCTVYAEDNYKPFFMIDANSEKDESHFDSDKGKDIAREYIGANITVGVKGPNKMEYSIKGGASQKDKDGTQSVSNNVEFKVKKSYALTESISPYVSLRLGEKFSSDGKHFTHYAVDTGVKFKLTQSLSFDSGLRYRNALSNSSYHKASKQEEYSYESVRIHGMLLLDLTKNDTVGLRYTQSTADNYEEERKGWRVHYQRNY